MHAHFIFMHGNEICMHENEICMHGNFHIFSLRLLLSKVQIFEDHTNPVMLEFIGELLLSTLAFQDFYMIL